MKHPFHLIRTHWRGELSASWVLLGSLGAITALWVIALNAVEVPHPTLRIGVVTLIGLTAIWQVTGAHRAARVAVSSGVQRPLAVLLYGGALAALLCLASLALNTTLDPPPPPEPTVILDPALTRSGDTVALNGLITLRGYTNFARMLDTAPPITRITLNSGGGAIHAARGLARLIKEHQIDTHVAGVCYSACTLVLIAGHERSATDQSQIGFHSYAAPGYANTGPLVLTDVQTSQEQDAQMFLAQGVAPAFVDRMFDAAHEAIWRPTLDALRAARVLTQ